MRSSTFLGASLLISNLSIGELTWSQSFGTYITDQGSVVELTQETDGSLSGQIYTVNPTGQLLGRAEFVGRNDAPGEIIVGNGIDDVTYARRGYVTKGDTSNVNYTEWYATTPTKGVLPASFRSIVSATSEIRSRHDQSELSSVATLSIWEIAAAQSALLRYYRSIEPEFPMDRLNESLFGSPVQVAMNRTILPWIEAVRWGQSGGNPHIQISLDTFGAQSVVASMDPSFIPVFENAALAQENSMEPAQLAVIPNSMELGIRLQIPSHNFMTKVRASNGFAIPLVDIQKVFDMMGTGPCLANIPDKYEIILECAYHSQDAGIQGQSWYRTALCLVMIDNGQPSIVKVFPSTLTAQGDRDDYNAISNDLSFWDSKFANIDRERAENFVMSRLTNAIQLVYASIE